MEKEDWLPKKERRALFIVVDGLDGIGKGEIERSLIEYEQKIGHTVFDTISFSKANSKGLAELKDFWNPPHTYYNTIVTAEPTYAGIGHSVRFELIVKNSRKYPLRAIMEAYALDRLISMMRLVIPALTNGIRVIQSRSVASTLNYQGLQAKENGIPLETIRKEILSLAGNKLQLDWAPDLLIIPTIKNISDLMKRLQNRKEYKKDDNAIFDDLKFQEKLKPMYEDPWLQKLFTSRGTKIEYIDASISPEETRKNAVEVYKKFLHKQ